MVRTPHTGWADGVSKHRDRLSYPRWPGTAWFKFDNILLVRTQLYTHHIAPGVLGARPARARNASLVLIDILHKLGLAWVLAKRQTVAKRNTRKIERRGERRNKERGRRRRKKMTEPIRHTEKLLPPLSICDMSLYQKPQFWFFSWSSTASVQILCMEKM